MTAPEPFRPADLARTLLAALDASDGRRKRRKRNTTPDTIGMSIKRALLERAVRDEPAGDDFEAWLLRQCLEEGEASGAIRAMALEILEEWRLAQASPAFLEWLSLGAPSDDADRGEAHPREVGPGGPGSRGPGEP